MKKFISIGLSLVMVGSLACLVACGDDEKEAVVQGDYTPLTQETVDDFDTALNAIDSNTIIGDTTAADWSMGISLYTDLYAKEVEGNEYSEFDLEASAKLSASQAPNGATDSFMGMYLKGEASATLKMEEKEKHLITSEFVTSTTSVEGNAYIDKSLLYVDYAMSEKSGSQESSTSKAMKFSLTSLMDEFMDEMGDMFEDMLPDMDDMIPDENIPDTSISSTELMAMLQPYGITLSYEYKEGKDLKIKVSLSETTFNAILAEEQITASFTASKADFYVVISSTGMLKKLSADIDVKASATIEGEASSIEAKGVFIVTVGDVEVKLPSNLATDDKYQFIPSFF